MQSTSRRSRRHARANSRSRANSRFRSRANSRTRSRVNSRTRSRVNSRTRSRADSRLRSGSGSRSRSGSRTRASLEQPPTRPAAMAEEPPCLCVYDFDETLTSAAGCPGAALSEVTGRHWLSPAAQNLHQTECGKCFSAIVSAGGPRPALEMVRLPRGSRSDVEPVIMWNVPAHCKGDTVPYLRKYYRDRAGVDVPTSEIHFYDDYDVSVRSFKDRQPDSTVHQVSCNSHSGKRGVCGAEMEEINRRRRDSYCAAT